MTDDEGLVSFRVFLTARTVAAGASPVMAAEAVAGFAAANPGWDMDEVRSWVEWGEVFDADPAGG